MPSARLQYLTALASATSIMQRRGVGFKRLFIKPSGAIGCKAILQPILSTRKRSRSLGSEKTTESCLSELSQRKFHATGVLDNWLRPCGSRGSTMNYPFDLQRFL